MSCCSRSPGGRHRLGVPSQQLGGRRASRKGRRTGGGGLYSLTVKKITRVRRSVLSETEMKSYHFWAKTNEVTFETYRKMIRRL